MGPDLIARAVAMASLAAFQAPDAVTVHPDSVRQETTYSVAAGACRIDWVVYASELNRSVVHQRSDCDLPPTAQTRLLSCLIEKVFADPGGGAIRTLF